MTFQAGTKLRFCQVPCTAFALESDVSYHSLAYFSKSLSTEIKQGG